HTRPDGTEWNLRWILVHMVEEYARHCGRLACSGGPAYTRSVMKRLFTHSHHHHPSRVG
ncbi:MAG: DUF664 domain-containing protein, partial [Acidimicrobiales bacterium]